jgi:hypothetical protein
MSKSMKDRDRAKKEGSSQNLNTASLSSAGGGVAGIVSAGTLPDLL